MTLNEAVAERILQLMQESRMTPIELARASKVSAIRIYALTKKKDGGPLLVTILGLCRGFCISLRDFFDCAVFDEFLK